MNAIKRSTTKLAGIGAIIVITLALLVGCSGTTTDEDQAGNDSPDKVLPITLQAHGNSYTIDTVAVTEGENGNTVIKCEGSGFKKLPIKNNQVVIPIYCSAIENGTETEFASFAAEEGLFVFKFNTSVDPDTVVFYPEDNKTERIKVPL